MSEKRPAAKSTVQIENARMRVTEWRLPPGGATGWHRHEHDYCVVPISSGKLSIEAREGTSVAELKTGGSYAREAGVEHDVVNANSFEFVFIEIELKEKRR